MKRWVSVILACALLAVGGVLLPEWVTTDELGPKPCPPNEPNCR